MPIYFSILFYKLLVSLTGIYIGVLVLKNQPKNHLNQLFFIFCCICSISNFFQVFFEWFLIITGTFSKTAVFLQLALASFGATLAVHVSMAYPTYPKWWKKRWFVVMYLPPLFFSYQAYHQKYFTNIRVVSEGILKERTLFYLLFILYGALCVILSTSIPLIKYLKTKNLLIKKQIKTLFIGSFVGGSIIVLDLILAYKNILAHLSILGFFVFLCFSAYSIGRFRAFDIKTAFHYSFFWFISRVIILLPIILCPLLVHFFIPKIETLFLVILSVYGFFSAMYVFFFKRAFLTKMDTLFLKRRFALEKANIQFSEVLYRIRKIDELADLIFKTIKQNLFSKEVFFLIPDTKKEQNWFDMLSSENVEHSSTICMRIDLIKNGIATLGSSKTFIFDKNKPSTLFENEVIPEELNSFDIKLMQVITSETDEILGILFLSEKKDFKPYLGYEIEFISALSKATSMGLSGIYFHQKNQELTQAKTFLKDALDGISHELKTAFYSTSGIKELVLKGGIKGENDLKQLYLDTVSFSEYIFHMVRNYGLSEQIEVGNISLSKTDFKIGDPVLMAIKLNDFYQKDKNIQIVTGGDLDIQLNADKEKLTVVISNLINNAIKYSPKNTCVEVLWNVQDESILMSILDLGYGIPKERLNVIFDKLTNQKVERGNNYFSLGFGLSVARSLIKLHGGDIFVESEVGAGTKVTLKIPL